MSRPRPDQATLPPVTLVLGGARSGKSRYAEALVESQPGAWIYLATAETLDDEEMAERVRRHKARRSSRWTTVEQALELTPALKAEARAGRAVLVDCLTLWLSNLMAAGRDLGAETEALAEALGGLAGPVVLVSNEVGLGIVPDNAVARDFRDHAGRLNQAVAGVSQRVVFMAAGLPMVLKERAAAEVAA